MSASSLFIYIPNQQPAKHDRAVRCSSLVYLFGALVLVLPTSGFTQDDALVESSTMPTVGGPLLTTQDMDTSDQQRLDKLSPADKKQFESKLRKATVLFFDNHYRLAIPLFKEIAARADTLSVLHMYGLAAYRSGLPDLAITKFETLLQRQPERHPVRMDLALAFLQKGDIKSAEKMLLELLAADPPQGIRNEADRLLAGLKSRDKQFFATFRASVGVQYDNNISAQTDDLPEVLTGTEAHRGAAFPLAASADTLYDFRKSGLAWRNRLSLYRIDYGDKAAFDFSQVDYRTGLEHNREKLYLNLPIGAIHREYAHDSLSNGWYLAPEGQYRLREGLDLKFGYRMDKERYTQDASSDQDHTTQTFTMGPSWRLSGERLQVLSLTSGFTDRDARGEAYSYDDWKIGSSYFTRFGPEIDGFVQAEYLDRSYNGNSASADIVPDAPDQRDDSRVSLTTVLSKTVRDIYTVSASFTYLANSSNTSIYDYDKYVVGLNFGITLDNR